MGPPQTPDPSHLYSQALQLKLYQAFIFSVPILFFFILILLFYLFYLKRRRDSILTSTSTAPLPWRAHQPATLIPMSFEMGLKKELKEGLPIIIFDEKISTKESQCCVCLGDFELKEQLHQIPSCKHVFHISCIQHWFQTSFTCPLCRCAIVSAEKQSSNTQIQPELLEASESANARNLPQAQVSNSEHEADVERGGGSADRRSCSSEETSSIQIEGSSSRGSCLTSSGDSSSLQGSVVIQIN
ncbi:hypothetical protein Scep_006002 [Stephania cephalantha]|uniref:RING-type E3 ubiquitin transferase n=1 Tax=Stephania cephalantha TaxID=152367 RepID=A0AAP0K8E6_9MAGN